MKKDFFKLLTLTALVAGVFSSCTKELNRYPTNGSTSQTVLSTAAGYKQELAKVYSAFAVTSNSDPGTTDVPGGDAGASDFLRLFWNTQEITTDEGKCAWLDNAGVQDLDQDTWVASNAVLLGLYDRCEYQILLANVFISQSSDANITSHGISGADATEIRYYRAEARFLRAYQYWVLMDAFGNVTYIDENSPIGAFFPKQIGRAALFSYIESELKAIDPLLKAPHKNEYARADQAAAWALLARVYLNAQVYTGTARWADAMTYSKKVIDAGYPLMTKYQNLFLADNNLNNSELIFPIAYDANYTKTYGGTTFLVNSSINNSWSETPAYYGVKGGGWSGNRASQKVTAYFPDTTGKTDVRAIFRIREKTLDTLGSFSSGIGVVKFKNTTSAGVAKSDASGTFVSTDFPLFRSAEMYLTYAEASVRSGNSGGLALQYYNTVRTRAYNNTTAGNVTSIALTDILSERGREFYWEATRRTDLIRFGLFTGDSYIWPFKGGTVSGGAIADYRSLFPIPQADVIANPNLKQNTGYN
ncbi:MAG: RagB/SusD family nutrient uptake outer membrane protein [Bacteroidota bacterium]|nr:RagB/SusD family nutrient uptake outer membrane protein [Bacteroidota bacterium]